MARVTMSKFLYSRCQGIPFVNIHGNSVKTVLENLVRLFPQMEQVLFTSQGSAQVRRFCHVLANGHEVRTLDELDRPLKEDDEIIIFPDVA